MRFCFKKYIIDPYIASSLGGMEKAWIIESVVDSIHRKEVSAHEEDSRWYIDGHYWMKDTAETWNSHLPWLGIATIKRYLAELKKNGWLISAKFGSKNGDQTNWYRVDMEKYADALARFQLKKPKPRGRGAKSLKQPIGSNCTDAESLTVSNCTDGIKETVAEGDSIKLTPLSLYQTDTLLPDQTDTVSPITPIPITPPKTHPSHSSDDSWLYETQPNDSFEEEIKTQPKQTTDKEIFFIEEKSPKTKSKALKSVSNTKAPKKKTNARATQALTSHDIDLGRRWFQFACENMPWTKPPKSWNPENFAKEINKMRVKKNLNDFGLEQVFGFITENDFYTKNCLSPVGMFRKWRNDLTKLDNILFELKGKRGREIDRLEKDIQTWGQASRKNKIF